MIRAVIVMFWCVTPLATIVIQAEDKVPYVSGDFTRFPGHVTVGCFLSLGNGKVVIGGIGRDRAADDIFGAVGICDLEAETFRESVRHGFKVATLALSPDGRVLATGAWERRNPSDKSSGVTSSVKLWDVPKFTARQTLIGADDVLTGMSMSPDGKRLAAGYLKGTVTVWELPSGKQVAEFQGHPVSVSCLCYAKDCKTLAVGGGKRYEPSKFILWDSLTGQEKSTEMGFEKGQVSALAFSPDGKTLAIGGEIGTVRARTVRAGQSANSIDFV